MAKYLVVNVGFILVFLLGFTTLLPMATQNFYGKFLLNLFGFTMMGISLTYFIPLLLVRWKAIEFVYPEPEKTESEARINSSLQM